MKAGKAEETLRTTLLSSLCGFYLNTEYVNIQHI